MTSVVKEINKYITMLSPEEQQQLAASLKKELTIAEAKRLSSFIPRHGLNTTDIVKQIRISRKKKYAAKRSA